MQTREITNDLILKTIKKIVEGETEILVEEAKVKLHERMPVIVSSVLVELTGYSEFETMRDRMIFTIKRTD